MHLRRDGIGLFLRYVVISLVPVVVLGAAVELYNRRQSQRSAIDIAQSQAQTLAEAAIEPTVALGGVDLDAMDAATRASLSLSLKRLEQYGNVAEVRLWSPRGELLVDGSGSPVDAVAVELDDELFQAAGGTTTSRQGPSAEELSTVDRPLQGRYLTVFVPVHDVDEREVRAVAELVVAWDHADYYAAQARLRNVLMGAVALLWTALGALTVSVARKLRRSDRAHRHMALFDQLTGLPNRRAFTDQAGGVIAALGPHGEPAVVVLLDLVGFTQINKAVGRAHGDALLRDVSQRLAAMIQPGQLLAHLGGDVFALLLPGVDSDAALELLPLIRQVLEAEVEVAGIPLSFEAAIGVAAYPAHGEDISTILQRADIAMEAAKSAHVGAQVFSAALDPVDPVRLGLAVELRRAIAKDELFLVYQPKVHLQDGTMRGVEALVRWNHPERGVVSPAEFIPVAEATGLIVPLTTWVLDRAAQQAAHWACNGLQLRVAVNVSAKNLRDERFPEQVLRVLARHSLPPEYIELELTETAIVADPERVARTIRRLREAGTAVALDDFGQGSTSLAHLRNLPLNTLKIDKCFVDDLCRNEKDAAIVYAMIALGHQLGLEVVAEGVETAEQHATLAHWGCDVAQGFYFERPLTVDQLTARFGRAKRPSSQSTAPV